MTYEKILKQLEKYEQELSTEDRLVRVGLKQTPQFTQIQKNYSDLFSRDTIALVRGWLTEAVDKDERDKKERVLFTLLEGVIANETMEVYENIVKERSRLSAEVDGQKIGYHEFTGILSKEKDFDKRESLRDEKIKLVEKLNPTLVEAERANRKNLATFGFKSVSDYAETKKKIKYNEFLNKTIPILEETTGLYRRVMSEMLKNSFGKELGQIGAVHALFLFSGRQFDHLFPADQLLPLCKGSFATMGLDLDETPAISIDADNRPKKDPRACCYAIKVPSEIHLIIKPRGGYNDYRTFMHEGGHSLHFAHTKPSLPYEWRHLSRSHALTEVFSFTMENLAENPLWLEHALRVPKDASEHISAWALLGNLFMLRRYIAKFTYELSFDANPYDATENRRTYAATLKELTGFEYEEAMYLEDMDGQFYSADYLRAWMASAQLEEHLIRTYGERWFLRKETGSFFKELYSKGVSWDNEDLIISLGMTPWDPLPLIRKFDPIKKLLK